MNRAKAINIISLLLSGLLALGGTSQSLAEECVTNAQSAPSLIGSRCTKDPSCVIVGGTHMLEWKSPAPAKIAVVCIHGLGLCARAYKPLAQELSAAGIDGFGVNVRGFGPDRDRPDREKLDCQETVGDVSKLLTLIHTEHPDYKVFLLGESMGGALAIRIAAENPELVDGVICSAPAWRLLKMRRTAAKGVFELFLFPSNKPGPAARGVMQQATSDPKLTEHWLTDPSHKLKLSFREATSFLSFIKKTDTYARQLSDPVLIVQGLNDRLVSPKAVAKLFKEIPSSNKIFLIDGSGEHLVLEEGRFLPPLAKKLIAWMKADLKAQSSAPSVEVINDQALSPAEKKHLLKLRRIANTPYMVKWAGALRMVHQGTDFGGHIDLAPLESLPHLYAVGPLENLEGEITIWNGKPLISRIKNHALQVDNELTGKACFLVYGQVRAWKKVRLSAPLDMSEIDHVVKQAATKYDINTSRPFPFLIEGSARYGRYHVMNRTDTAPPSPGPASHNAAKVSLSIKNAPVELLGFYSEHHQGIFTHHSSFVHLHIKTPDNQIAGHLEELELERGSTLLLPKGYSR